MNSYERYWCHRCRIPVTLREGEPLCPSCEDGFLEQFDDDYPGIRPFPPHFRYSNVHSRSPAARREFWAAMRARRPSRWSHGYPYDHPSGPGHTSSLQLLELMSFLSSPSRHNLEARREIEDAMMSGFFPRRGFFFDEDEERSRYRREMDAGEVLLGTGLETLILHLQDGDGDVGRHGSSVPAAKAAVDAMPTFNFKKQSGQFDDMHCAVCKEAFEAGGEVREMPCKHIYHSGCILPWLALNRSCPICRHEMPAEESMPNGSSTASEGIIMARGRLEGGRGTGLAIIGHGGDGMRVRSLTLWGLGGSRLDNALHPNDIEGMDSTTGRESQRSTTPNVSSGREPESERARQGTPVCTTDSEMRRNIPAPNGEATRTSSNSAEGDNCGLGSRIRNWFWRHGRAPAPPSTAGSETDSGPNYGVRRHWL